MKHRTTSLQPRSHAPRVRFIRCCYSPEGDTTLAGGGNPRVRRVTITPFCLLRLAASPPIAKDRSDSKNLPPVAYATGRGYVGLRP